MNEQQMKDQIAQSIQNLAAGNAAEKIEALFQTLGYSTTRKFELDSHNPNDFLDMFGWEGINQQRAIFSEWKSVDFLFQLTEDEIKSNGQLSLFSNQIDQNYLQSYIFLAVGLRGNHYNRTDLSNITREVNRQSDIPIMVLFRHDDGFTLSIINRRPHKRETSKDVLEKITLIKDINIFQPHRAHIEILFDLSLPQLFKQYQFTNFDQLHDAWQKTLDTSELNKRFFKEVANWYFWAVQNVTFPEGAGGNVEIRNATSVIRLITRLIFVWFLKEKGLVPDDLFNYQSIQELIKSNAPEESTYYKAILQNLFFATLNQEMNTPSKPDNRKFRNKAKQAGGRDQNYMVHNVYRYEDYFHDSQAILRLFDNIPFLNGGLFECLDKPDGDNPKQIIRIDGFSDRKDNLLNVPNFLFFNESEEVDLNDVYGTKNKHYRVRGLINIFHSYKFTITENTPIEEEIALDPELLGKVFENLLAAYNPETNTTARKQTGSFYTPREIVDYMVDEALIAYLEKVTQASSLYKPSEKVTQASSLYKPSEKVTQASSLSSANVEHKQDACVTLKRYKPSQNRQNTYTNIEELGFFDPDTSVSITARNLPHWQQDGVTYFVTFRLADSVPQEKLRQWQDEREKWLKENKQPFSKAQKAEYYQLFSEKINNWLDAGMGSCYLKEPHIAKIVADALHYFNGDRYILGEWVVMPNHVHLLVTPLGDRTLSAILHSWKSFTANQVNKVLNRQGKFWQEESFDHIVRNHEQLERIQQYIAENPQKAGIKVTQAFSLSSANVEHKQDACATKVTQAFSLSSANVEHKQDACATKVTQAFSLSSANVEHKQDACATLDRLRHLFAYNDQPHQFTDTEVSGLIEAIDHLKILDPACGSGAFPMGILHKLVFILTKLDPQNRRWKEKQIAKANEIPDSTIREKVIEDIEQAFEHNELDYGRKLYLIENCIYGVDIQPVAIQIAKLRFFISLIVHQNIDNSLENRGVRPLPNLETKFVAANALLGIKGAGDFTLRDPRIEEKEKELAEVRRSYFMARTPKTKAKYRELDDRIRHQISEILKSGGFPGESAEKLAIWKPYEQNTFADFFDAEWMFGISDGFDICIGNPPYVRQEQIKEFKPIFKSQYDCYTGVADLYVYFYEQGLKLLKNQGILCYISSNKYFRSGYGEKLRKFLANQSTILQLIDFGDAPIFTAIAYPSIIIASKEQPENHQTRVLNWELGQAVDQFAFVFENQSFLMAQKELTADGWRLESSTVLNLLEKLRKAGTPLGEYVNGRFYRGILTGFNEAFVVDRETRDRLIAEHPSSAEVLKPFLRGKDVKRWGVNFAEQYLIKIESSENKQHPWSGKSAKDAEKTFAKTYPAIHARFDELREELSKRSDQGKFFWELRSCKYWQEFEQPKIVWGNLATSPQFSLASICFYLCAPANLIVSQDSYYLLAILNSKITQYIVSQNAAVRQGGFLEFKPMYFSQIPIPNAQPQEKLAIEILVNYIIYLTAEIKDIPSHGERMVATAEDKLMLSYFEQIVDALVMELYLPEELHSHDKYFMRHVLSENLPAFDTIKGDKMPALRQIFKRLFDSEHPIRVNIYFLNSLEVVRIIRGLG